eukprot:gene17629-23969_t
MLGAQSAPGEFDPSRRGSGSKAIKQALSTVDATRVKGLGVSGQQHGMVVLDKHGQVLRDCKLWCDTESAAEAEEISQKLNSVMVPSFTATKLLWLQRNEPEIWDRTAHVLLPHDYYNYYLTGRMVMESGDASGTGVFDTRRRDWDLPAMAVLEGEGWPAGRIRALFPQLIGASEVLGYVKDDVPAELGLPPEFSTRGSSGSSLRDSVSEGATIKAL